MKKSRFFTVACAIAILLAVLTSCNGQGPTPSSIEQSPVSSAAPSRTPAPQDVVVLKYGGTMSTEDYCTQAQYMVADLVKEKTNGTLVVEVYPSGQLGDAVAQLEATSIGSQDLFTEALGYTSSVIPQADILTFYYVFEGRDHYSKFIESDIWKSWIEEYCQKTGTRIVESNWLRCPRVICSKTPITGLADMQNIKVRIPATGIAMLESFKAMGMNPTPVAWGEVYLALQQGVVEACEGPVDSCYSMKFYEPTMNITKDNHNYDSLGTYMNDAKLQSLSEEHRTALLEALHEAGLWYSEQTGAYEEECYSKMAAEGCNVIELEPAKKQELADAVKKRILELEGDGTLVKGVYDQIQALL